MVQIESLNIGTDDLKNENWAEFSVDITENDRDNIETIPTT